MKTYSPKASDLRPQWHVLDAAGQTLGRLAVRVAHLLKGKHKPIYSPHMLVGDFVVIINSRRIKVTGNKIKQKIYYHHSLYPGGLKEIPLAVMLAKHPNRVIEHAVKGMLPHNRLGRQMMRRLKTYPDSTHPHEAQVTASLKVAEKEEAEGVVWIGLPKLVIRRRPKRKRATVSTAVADETSQVEETATEEEPTSEVAAAATVEAAQPEAPPADETTQVEETATEEEPTSEVAAVATVEAAQPETPTADETSQHEETAADEPSVAEQEAPVDDSPPETALSPEDSEAEAPLAEGTVQAEEVKGEIKEEAQSGETSSAPGPPEGSKASETEEKKE